VPEYNPELRQMTKCNFCFDNIEAGLPPACVAACPMRVLDFVTVDEGNHHPSSVIGLWSIPASEHPFPLPNFSNTEPHIAIVPHMAMDRGGEARIANREEVRPQGVRLFAEAPLIAFTLLGQMSVGMIIPLTRLGISARTIPALIVSLGLAFTATLIAFLHLGKPVNARHALKHLQKSWLSRELLMLSLFGLSGAITVILYYFGISNGPIFLTAILGVGLVVGMAHVYRLRTMPAWDYQHTLVAFLLSAGLLGLQAVNLAAPLGWMRWVLPWLFAGELVLALAGRKDYDKPINKLRIGMIAAGFVAGLALSILPEPAWLLSIPLFLLSIIEEIIGRWSFYDVLRERPL
jgi:DMSO reductase anchor subunit